MVLENDYVYGTRGLARLLESTMGKVRYAGWIKGIKPKIMWVSGVSFNAYTKEEVRVIKKQLDSLKKKIA